jgi:hypothetical protein
LGLGRCPSPFEVDAVIAIRSGLLRGLTARRLGEVNLLDEPWVASELGLAELLSELRRFFDEWACDLGVLQVWVLVFQFDRLLLTE